jgi:hypothetical protein
MLYSVVSEIVVKWIHTGVNFVLDFSNSKIIHFIEKIQVFTTKKYA